MYFRRDGNTHNNAPTNIRGDISHYTFFQLQVILFQKTPTVKSENMKRGAATTNQEEIKLNRLQPLLVEINEMITKEPHKAMNTTIR